jgi:type IV pilus assembly protein PilM
MLGFVQNFLAPKANPIGVDFGSDGIRMAQCQLIDGEWRLIAAAGCDVPSHVRHDQGARLEFFVGAVRELLAEGKFHGRQAVLGLPAALMFIQHLRLPKMDDEAFKKALPWEARGKLPIDPSHALMRHIIAGEIYSEQELKNEIVLMAASRELVNQFLACAAKAKLDVVGMNVEPMSLIDCFGHVYRRKTDADVTNCFIDIGCTGTRAIVARGSQIFFARNIPIGGDHFTRAVAAAMKIGAPDAKILRVKLAAEQQEPPRDRGTVQTPEQVAPSENQSFALLNAALASKNEAPAVERRAASPVTEIPAPQSSRETQQVNDACSSTVTKLVDELNLCRRYYEATFADKPIQRLIFVGGEARQRALCQQIAREMSLPAQVGDPLVRMGKTCEVSACSGIDRRQPQPAWAVALGLSMGPVKAPVPVGK